MSLYNAYSGGSLIARTDDAVAISTPRVQQLVDADYTRIENLRVIQKLENISDIKSTVNTLTSLKLTEGEELFIRKSDGQVYPFTVGPVTPALAGIVPKMVSDELSSGRVVGSILGIEDYIGFKAFDGNNDTYCDIGATGNWLGYRTENDELIEVKEVYILNFSNGFTCKIQGSTNGIDWTDLTSSVVIGNNASTTIPLTTTGMYNFYRVYLSKATSRVYFKTLQFYTDGFLCDTSAVTAGEAPINVYRTQDKIYFNDSLSVENVAERDFRISYDAPNIKMYSLYPLINLTPAREIITKIEFAQKGNTVVEMTGEIYAMTYTRANDIHTANDAPNTIGTISLSGATAASVVDVWKLFNNDFINDSVMIPTGAGGAVDLAITYTFVEPVIIHATKIAYSLTSESIADFTIEGSNDGVTWDTVYEKIDQGLSIDNLIITKVVDTFGSYTQYKINITRGVSENSNIVLKEFSLMKEQF